MGGIIGLLQRDPTEFLQGGAVSDGLSNEEIEDLIARRKQARADKNWAESDRIRDLLNEHKIILEDNAGGTTWRRGNPIKLTFKDVYKINSTSLSNEEIKD